MGSSGGKSSTTALDEMYRQFGTLPGLPVVNGNNLGVSNDGATEALLDVWAMESFLMDPAFYSGQKDMVTD